jgi:hypothetical protein
MESFDLCVLVVLKPLLHTLSLIEGIIKSSAGLLVFYAGYLITFTRKQPIVDQTRVDWTSSDAQPDELTRHCFTSTKPN